MTPQTFKALEVREQEDGTFVRVLTEKYVDELPQGDVLVRVHYSSLNYKDALSAGGHRGITREYPHTPGIDAAGRVEESRSGHFKSGDPIIVTSYDLGMNTPGGYGQYIRVPEEWIVPLPKEMTLEQSMKYGTAGFTAGLALHKLLHNGLQPGVGEVLVTGATGGVGSLSIALLSNAGFKVTAATGKTELEDYLKQIGADAVIHRSELKEAGNRPLLKRRWAGAIDTVGGEILSAVVRSVDHEGSVALCGNAASNDLPLSVLPFILRGVNLLGVDSGNCKMPLRRIIWKRLSTDWKLTHINDIVREVSLEKLDHEIEKMLDGRQRGRVLVNLQR